MNYKQKGKNNNISNNNVIQYKNNVNFNDEELPNIPNKIRIVNNLNLKENRTKTQQIKILKIKMVITIHYKITLLVSMEIIKMEIINKIIITIKIRI